MRTAPHRGCSVRCGRSAVAALRESGVAQVRDDSSSASRRAKQNDASAPPCPARPSRACLASRTNHVPAVTRIGGRGDGAAVDDGPGCRRRADAAAPSSRGRDLGGRGPKRRVLRQADGGRAQMSLSWLADTRLSQDRATPIRFCRPTGRAQGVRCAGSRASHVRPQPSARAHRRSGRADELGLRTPAALGARSEACRPPLGRPYPPLIRRSGRMAAALYVASRSPLRRLRSQGLG